MYRFTDKSIAPTYRVLDTAVAIGSLVLALIVMNLPNAAGHLGSFLETRITLKNVLLLSGLSLAWPSLFAAFGLYRLGELNNVAVELSRIARACTVGSVFAVVVALTSTGAFGALSILAFLLTVIIGTACTRAATRWVLRTVARLRSGARHVIIAGTGPRAVQLYGQLAGQTSCNVVGFVDTSVKAPPLGASGPPFLGTIDDLEHILVSRAVDAVHIALPVKSCYAAMEHVIRTCERVGVESSYQADIFRRSLAQPRADEVSLFVALEVVVNDYRLWMKRVIDVCGALFGLVVFSPVMLAAAAAIRLTSPGPILFAQERFGYNRRRMRMYKFRTMVADAEARQAGLEQMNEAQGPVFKIQDDPRVTAVGRFLRRTSIDELPQFLNVLKGEMSLVGPRPLPVRDVSGFAEASLMRRFSVKPGLTCLWQINGRSNTSFDHWIEMDLEYIDRWSLALDLAILAKTVPAVLRGRGAA